MLHPALPYRYIAHLWKAHKDGAGVFSGKRQASIAVPRQTSHVALFIGVAPTKNPTLLAYANEAAGPEINYVNTAIGESYGEPVRPLRRRTRRR